MEIIRLTYPNIDQQHTIRQVMAIGYFDGVHLGHQEVIRRAIHAAKKEKLVSSIMTFSPHPREVLGNNPKETHYITPEKQKLEQFANLGVDRTYILTFDRTLSKLSPEQFIHEILFALHVETVVVGFNFTFGNLGRGNVDLLQEIGAERMKVNVVRPYHTDNMKVSSTIVREKLHAGDMKLVAQLLGRPYTISGLVVHGLGRGRTIGIPTANIEPQGKYIIPHVGVYAVRVHVNNHIYDGVINVGYKPTFDDHPAKPTLEVHILNFNQSIYDQVIQVEWLDYIRSEQKFSSVDHLVEQIQADILKAKQILSFTS